MSLEISNEGRKQLAEALNRKALKIVREAKQNAPVDTGRLRSSITADLAKANNLQVRVGTNVEYADDVEFGTVNQPAQPYLRPAVRKVLETNRVDFNFT